MNSPWDYELQRHLIQGGRKLSTSSILRKPKRYIQSAGSRLLKEYESDEQNELNNKYDDGKSRRYNPLDNDEEFLNIEFYADNYPSKRHSSSIDANTLEKRKEYFHRISSSTKLGSLRLTLTDIMKKIEDNECMGIHTFSYLDENNVEKLPIGKESDIHSTSAITRPTSISPTVDYHQRHSQTGILLPSSQISTSSSPSSLSEDLNNSNETIDEINEPNKFIVSSIKRIQPINAFKRIIIAGLLLRATLNLIRPIQELKDAKLRSKSAQTFVELQKNIEVKLSCEHLGFDKFAFKINREKHLTYDAVKILTLPSKYRTESMIHSATVAVIATIEAFSEFPIAMQKAIIGKAWYEKYEARRMIIRQGQPPLNFYFIISGSDVMSLSVLIVIKGLESIAFEPFGGTTSVSLVSNGAECVAINKQFFVENCPTNFLNWLRSKVQPFPSVDELESKLNTYRQWKIYRKSVVRHISTATT
ncbi:Kinesin heavy chain [Schistosoma japonicum]|nr:Kinesin heavy chain [Schistosoma japonicum]